MLTGTQLSCPSGKVCSIPGVLGGNYVRDHAKMMATVACSKVPKISIVIGNSIGPTYSLMVS